MARAGMEKFDLLHDLCGEWLAEVRPPEYTGGAVHSVLLSSLKEEMSRIDL
jgi:hypothetical protein